MIGTLAVDGWAFIFDRATKVLGVWAPSHCTEYQWPVYEICVIRYMHVHCTV